VAYTMLSYWPMLLKVRYPAEFFASGMSILDSDRMPGLVADEARFNLRVGPPDINTSTDKFEVLTDPATGHSLLVAPFNSVANISEKGA
ncbi:hypothetical protein, partial [Pseudoalteromonas sp. SIMBA_162]|uniref:hypothetical protein n=1 Tax=Pseudoalteromonas sp. SIMBA_162 TaxID=3080867 RepID=UPI00397A2389